MKMSVGLQVGEQGNGLRPVEPPAAVTVGPHTYRVETDPASFLRVTQESDESALLGHTDHRQLLIHIDETVAPSMVRVSLLHEVLHTACAVMGLSNELEDADEPDWEEELVARLAPVLLQALRANPRFVEFLLAEA